MRFLSLLLCCMLLSSCDVPDISRKDRPIIYKTSVSLLEDIQGFKSISEQFWPLTLKRLEPTRVYVTDDGLYIVKKSFFVTEQGYFIPRYDWEVDGSGDPAYTNIGDGIYSYEIKG